MTTLNLQVDASLDDAHQRQDTGAMFTADATIRIGNLGGNDYDAGFRWTGVSGLSGAIINSAIATFRADLNDNGAFVGTWFVENIDAPAAFAAIGFDISSRSTHPTTQSGDGFPDFGAWSANTDETFDFLTLLQALADDHDPSAIVLIHKITSGGGERLPRSFDSSSITAAKLDIDFTAAPVPTGRTHGMTSVRGALHLLAAQRDDADGNPTNEFLFLRVNEFGQILTTTEGVPEVVTGRTKGATLRVTGNTVLLAAQRDDPDGNPTNEYILLRVDQFGRLRTTSEAAGTPVAGRTQGMTQRVTGNVVLGSAQRDNPDGEPTEQYLMLRVDEFGRLRMVPE